MTDTTTDITAECRNPARFNALFGEARLLDDGRHVEFTHECRNGPVVAVLPSPPWTVVVADPILVEPSIRCQGCGWHGWIVDGVARQIHVSKMPTPEDGAP